ncbi:MAG: hypothetical protein J5U19_03075 [Candidatus Methanoperedens sp.]|nr:hypothetical protein [Candidatus Methanoperedens sp.]MCE8427363.1 hypothetical protein [Candidatus Methanoperedens sp.]
MEVEFKDNEIIFNRESSVPDNPVLDFVGMLKNHNIKYVIFSGYIDILFRQNRITDDIDILIENITFEKFLKFWLELERSYECINTSDPIDAYNGYMKNHHEIGIVKKGHQIPNFVIKFVKTELDRYSMKYRKKAIFDDKTLFISPLELHISYKLFLGSEKDLENAGFLFRSFGGGLNIALLDMFLNELNIPEESVEKYLGMANSFIYEMQFRD